MGVPAYRKPYGLQDIHHLLQDPIGDPSPTGHGEIKGLAELRPWISERSP